MQSNFLLLAVKILYLRAIHLLILLKKVSTHIYRWDNFLHMFLASGGEKVAEQKLDETEEVEVVAYSIDELKQLLKENKIVQSLHVSCIFYALNHLKEMKY